MIVISVAATLFLFHSPSFAQQSSSSQNLQIPIIFHFPDKDIPATLDTQSIRFVVDASKSIEIKKIHWQNSENPSGPAIEFTSGAPAVLTADLFFDTYEQKTSVKELTDKIAELALTDPDKHTPCRATFEGVEFKCIIESTQIRFTLFLDDGTPVRAVMHTVFKEFTPVNSKPNHNTLEWKDLLPLLDASGNSPWLLRSYGSTSLAEIPNQLFGNLNVQQTTSTLFPSDQTAVQGFMIKIVGSEITSSNSWDFPQGGDISVSVSDSIINRALFTSWQSGQLDVSQSGDFEPLNLKGPLAKIKPAIESWIENHPAPCNKCKDVTFGFSSPDGQLLKEYHLSVLDGFYFKNQILLLSIQPDDMLHVTLLNIDRTRADGSPFSGPPRILTVLPSSVPNTNLFGLINIPYPVIIGGFNFDQSAIPYFGTIPDGQLFNFGLKNLPLVGSVSAGIVYYPGGFPSGTTLPVTIVEYGQTSNAFPVSIQ